MRTKFFPNIDELLLTTFLAICCIIIIPIILLTCGSMALQYAVVFIVLLIFALVFLCLIGLTSVTINATNLDYKKNLFYKIKHINLQDIKLVYLYYSRSKFIEIEILNNAKIKFGCTYKGLNCLLQVIPVEKFSLGFNVLSSIPKNHKELLIHAGLLKDK